MALDPRTPVIVGAGQSLRKPDRVTGLPEPVDMMVDVLRAAAADAGPGGPALLQRADSVRVVDLLSWKYANAAALVASRLGASPRETVQSAVGGNSPQMLVNDAAAAIARGDYDVVLICGAEAIFTHMVARKNGEPLEWTKQPDGTSGPLVMGVDRPGTNDVEMAHSLVMPTQVYPIFENALRHAAGESIDEHQVKISSLWSRFSEVAAGNPYAWSPEAKSADEIRTVTPANRMIGFPYPKLMNANIQTDQAAALILCSVAAASSAGVAEDRWVFPWAGADAHDHWFVSERENLHSSPAIAACGRAVFGSSGLGADDIAHVDLYSCFPSAVQIGAAALGFGLDDADRPLTVTGGLSFAGGPGNNYVTHSIAAMVERLRGSAGASFGLVTALGWYVTKHSVGLYSTQPTERGFAATSVQDEVDALPKRAFVDGYEGPATIESFTVLHEHDGAPAQAVVACLTANGERAWANTNDPDAMKALMVEDRIGTTATLRGAAPVELS